jgi:uncharacterized protein (DUF433 family)
MTTTEHPYIVRYEEILGGEPVIRDTRTPVRAVVENWRMGMEPVEMTRRLPHLSLAAIFDALSYYQDHQPEINGYIEENRVPEHLIDPRVRAIQRS